MASLTMILLAALLCNYGRGFCLIDIGTEGTEGYAKRRSVTVGDAMTNRLKDVRDGELESLTAEFEQIVYGSETTAATPLNVKRSRRQAVQNGAVPFARNRGTKDSDIVHEPDGILRRGRNAAFGFQFGTFNVLGQRSDDGQNQPRTPVGCEQIRMWLVDKLIPGLGILALRSSCPDRRQHR